MNTLWLIAKKEIDHSLNSQLAYILILIFVVSLPIPLFWASGGLNVFLNGHADLRAFFMMLPLFLMVFVPALAMRAWAEERASGTMELLLSFPISNTSLVLGKFLGLYLLLCVCILATLPLPFLVDRMGDLDWGPVWGGYCAALLLAACCLAVAMLAGALTRSPVTAFILGFLLLAVLMFSSLPALNPHSRFVNIARGVLDSRDLLFYLLATAAFLWLNRRIIQPGRLRQWSPVDLISPVALVILAIVSQTWFLRHDMTADRLYTLNQASIDLIGRLEKPLHIKLYLSENLPARFRPFNEYIKTLMDEYATLGGENLRVTYVDPGARLELVDEAHKLGIYETKANVAEKSRVEMVYIWFGLALFYEGRHEVFPTLSSLENFEYDLSSAIARLSADRKPVLKLVGPTYANRGGVVFEAGAQLKAFYDALSGDFQIIHEDTDRGNPNLTGADVVFAWGLHGYTQDRLQAIDRYLVEGGRLVLLTPGMWVDPVNVQAAPLAPSEADRFFEHLGFQVNRDLVCDQVCTKIKFTQTRPPVLKAYPLFPALYAERDSFDTSREPTASLNTLILPWASSLEVRPNPQLPVRIMARTSDQSWLLTGTPEIDPARVPGPTSFERYTVGLSIEGSFTSFFNQAPQEIEAQNVAAARTGKLHVWSSEHLLTQLQNPSIPAFLAHSAAYMASGVSLTEIDRRASAFRPIREMTLAEKNRYKRLSVLIAPLFIICFAAGRYLIRRKRNVQRWLNGA